TVLTVGLGIRLGLITLSPELSGLEVLASPYVLIAAGVIYLVEFFADKIPWVDSIWDSVHTVIRPLGAAVIGATAIGAVEPQTAVIAALCAGVSLSGHSVKAGTRLLANHSPEPFSNIALSLGEDFLVVIGSWLALRHPAIMVTIVAIFLIAFAWFAPKAFRLMRVEYLATLALLKKFYLLAKQYVQSFGQRRELAAVGSEFTVPVDVGSGGSAVVDGENSDDVPEHILRRLDNKTGSRGRRFFIRCTAGKGVTRLRHSVGYLQIDDDNLVFVTKRMFRVRDHQTERSKIEDIQFKKGLLFDRLTIRTSGKQKQFYFFKDVSNRGSRAYEILKRPLGRVQV
ncbi:MAG TPA: DUF4126 domain-containing protein, partial [Pyrinomonadaceae bacterium]|nr:DUF4126 domain-containing protein [Pyrinomonadaceae bacterium]